MSGVSSNTGLIAARVTPIYKTKSKKLELLSISRPAPFTIRPFAGLFNPFPYGCSVLCNHPADCEAKEFIRRAKESWAMEGKALLLPAEMEMIRATLIAGGIIDTGEINDGINVHTTITTTTTTTVPEELFRKYTETDSRPLTPTPTLASGPLTAHQTQSDLNLVPCNPRERTTLILDLRTASQEQDETLSWHALTLELPPSPKRANEYFKSSIQHRHQSRSALLPVQTSDDQIQHVIDSSRNQEEDEISNSDNEIPIRRRGKRLKKRRCRRGSAYGQQNEVRDPLEPTETQVSQVADSCRRKSSVTQHGNVGELENIDEKIFSTLPLQPECRSFISSDILKHLARELDRETVEAEFSLKRRIALEEALRVKKEINSNIKSSSRQVHLQPLACNAPRVFSRQSARFELVNSGSLSFIKPLDYIEKYVSITSGRKVIFSRIFNKYYEDSLDGVRCISPNDFFQALREVMEDGVVFVQHMKDFYLHYLQEN
ncbi:uncharacterized protein LOC130664863 isoform X2 [Microplitis mediator]|uniref:uncharacterized protein LOC130664863 isoform X2 n=1 Tax=Microplitis mediator TaxID=375433 RepID=UPI002552D336|nr:uncharacterized protein LOC130664863 isoform X2 [Microplitis mediator]